MPSPPTPPGRTIAVVPVRSLEGAKLRLGEVLDPEERRDLVVELLVRTIDALCGASFVDSAIIVSSDEEALEIARARGAMALRQTGGGLNAALEQARATALDLGATRLVVVPGDLWHISSAEIDTIVGPLDPGDRGMGDSGDRPGDNGNRPGENGDRDTSGPGDRVIGSSDRSVVLVPDRHGRGTNLLILQPPGVIPFAFGGDSRIAHRHLALDAGASYVEREGPLTMDVDTPADLIATGPPDEPSGPPSEPGA